MANVPRATRGTHNKKAQKRKPARHNEDAAEPLTGGALKKQTRDLERLLRRDALPADVRAEKERALADYRRRLAALQLERRRKAMISKYHMVRFFERQKATRALKQRRRALAATDPQDTAAGESARRAVHEAEVDFNYTLYFPLMQKYQSLFPKPDAAAATAAAASVDGEASGAATPAPARPAMWFRVEEAMAWGTLERLREERDAAATGTRIKPAWGQGGKAATTSAKKLPAAPDRHDARDAGVESAEEDAESEGFFEE